jgi:ATP adenylyltransferase
VTALRTAIAPDGFNVGINLGRVAGAGLEQHIHIHIVPRWNGDTNFMPVFAEVKVIPQALLDLYDQLRPIFDELG